MDQMKFILTQYGVFLLAAGILLLLLQQIVILRKMTVTRRQLEILRKEVANSRDMIFAELKEHQKNEQEEISKAQHITAEGKQTKAEQGELIDAVLSEVFS